MSEIDRLIKKLKLEVAKEVIADIEKEFDVDEDLKAKFNDIRSRYEKEADKKGTKEKKKITRLPNQYNLYVKDKMKELRQEFPNDSNKEIMKRAVEHWNADKAKKGEAVVDTA